MSMIDDFFKALSDSEELRSKVNACTSAFEAVKVAASAGFTISEAELIEAYKSRMSEMSEEQLSSVAGGKNDSNKNSACCKNN